MKEIEKIICTLQVLDEIYHAGDPHMTYLNVLTKIKESSLKYREYELDDSNNRVVFFNDLDEIADYPDWLIEIYPFDN